jgi:hypothetical protein
LESCRCGFKFQLYMSWLYDFVSVSKLSELLDSAVLLVAWFVIETKN